VARNLGEEPGPRPTLTIDSPADRACVIRELAANHNLRHDVFRLLGNDVFGISRDEIEREVGRLRSAARRDLEFHFDGTPDFDEPAGAEEPDEAKHEDAAESLKVA